MNKVILIGRVGKEPEIKESVASFSLATVYKKAEGEKITEWHNIKVFGRLKEIVEKWVRKGNRVCVEGRIQTTKWEEKYYTDIMVERLEIIDFPEKEQEAVTDVGIEPAPIFADEIPF